MHINLAHTLSSGQTFAFEEDGGGYVGVAGGRPCRVEQRGGDVAIDCLSGDEPFWREYFDLDADYDALLAPHRGDAALSACADACAGLRLLRQEVWETVCAFIISANNHQKRIESIYRGVSRALGEAVEFRGRELRAFPSPERLAAAPEEALRACGAGYRAPYLIETARMVAQGFPLGLSAMPYAQALAHLTRLKGVGEKVADCVLLFSGRHGVAFPIDVWMERVLRRVYGMEGTKKQIKRQAQARFGERAGLIQQYLFHGARTGALTLDGRSDDP